MEKPGIGIFGDTGMVGGAIDEYLKKHDSIQVRYRRNSKRAEGSLSDCTLCFLATKDSDSMKFAKEASSAGVRVIDMSGAFRLDRLTFEKWYGIPHTCPELIPKSVYGMPALFRDLIKDAEIVANPGCFATSVILTLSPLKGLFEESASVVATSGNSGARREIESEANDITYSYGTKHKHVPEMNNYSCFDIDFTPIVLRSVFRGINTNIRLTLSDALLDMSANDAVYAIENRIRSAYCPDDLVFVERDSKEKLWGTKDVNGTNKMIIKVRVDSGHAYICSMLDNLIKGAAGQAIENMNIMLGLPRLTGVYNADQFNS